MCGSEERSDGERGLDSIVATILICLVLQREAFGEFEGVIKFHILEVRLEILFYFILFFYGCNCSIWKFWGQGLILVAAATYSTAIAMLDP